MRTPLVRSAFPLSTPEPRPASPDELEQWLAAPGYPGFAHVRSRAKVDASEVVLSAILAHDLDVRLVEALPWVLVACPDLDWPWLRDRARRGNAQNRLGYLACLAHQIGESRHDDEVTEIWARRLEELEAARLDREGTLCRDSMPEPERDWLRNHRPAAAAHWNLLTDLTIEQLSYAAR